MTNIFPVILIVMNLCAGIVYGYNQEWLKCFYWLCACGLNVCVFYMK